MARALGAPWSLRRQVPMLWGRGVFGPTTVALLYGSRLGVGPLTVLRTWLWWAAALVGASSGPWWSAATGAVFGAGRVAAMVAAGPRAGAAQGAELPAAAVLAAGVLAAALGSCALGGGAATPAPAPTATSAPGRSGAPAVPASTTAPPPAPPAQVPAAPVTGLERLLPPGPLAVPGPTGPSGGVLDPVQEDPAKHLGPLDLAAAARAERDSPAEQALLETRGFRHGHARAWRDGAGRVAYGAVYEFASAEQAQAYLVDGITTIEARQAQVYRVVTIAGAQGFSQALGTGPVSSVSHGVVFAQGPRFFLVTLSGPGPGATPAGAEAIALAIRDHAALASGGLHE